MKLAGWARSVKARHARGNLPPSLPPLWLFTDRRIQDLPGAIRHLPCRAAGLVVREDAIADRPTLRRLLRLCAARHIVLSFAAPPPLLPPRQAGQHLQGGAGPTRRAAFRTSSAHDGRQMRRAGARGAVLIFLSPVFATTSHPEAKPLGPLRFAALATPHRHRVAALGGVNARTLSRLPGWCRHLGAISAIAPDA